METKAQLYIERHRIGSDGHGVRTLVTFTGCPLDCKYCLNEHLKKETPDGKWYTPRELLDELSLDQYYFLASGGGITFGGGEPLLRGEFIREFCELCKQEKGWSINIETSLNVPLYDIEQVAPFVDTFIVDIKDLNPEIYSRYTQGSVNIVYANLDYLKDVAIRDYDCSVIVRIPTIPRFNTQEDIDKTVKIMEERYEGLFSLNFFEYYKDKNDVPEADGKKICRILKTIRRGLIEENGLSIVQPRCTHKGNCPGTCPACESELAAINQAIGDEGDYYAAAWKVKRYGGDLSFGAENQNNNIHITMGLPQVLGDLKIMEPTYPKDK